ncbi:hypothetical protein CFP56_034613 [Quercus suber]|uniref:Uncharacterized protein n=1 Tax=Quercus suber TaxID=58331 RepID=A0AAW0JBQ5_QUESU
MDEKRGDEGSDSVEKRNTVVVEEKGARQGEEDDDVAETINDGVTGTESPTKPDPINDGYTIMDVTLNSLACFNSGNNNQKEDFSGQLEEIDREILKFDNVHVSGVILADNTPKEGVGLQKGYNIDGLGEVGLQKGHSVNGLGGVGHNLSNEAGKEKLMPQKRTWVRRKQNRGEPSGNASSVLKKRVDYRSSLDLIEAVVEQGSAFTVAFFSTIAWSIWQRRNKIRVQQPSWPLHEIGKRAKELLCIC